MKHLPKTAIITKQEYNMVAYHKPSSKESVSPERYLYFDVVVVLVWLDHPVSYVCGSVATGRTSYVGQVKGDGPDKNRYPSPGFGVGAWG
jgi:hypothetical protein